MNIITFFAFDPDDTEAIRLEKAAAFLIAGSCCVAGSVWAAMYYAIFGLSLTALLPAIFVVVVGSALVISHLSKNHKYAIYAQIICIMYITAFIQWSIGDIFDSGFVMVWALIGPICALMFFSIRQSVVWLLLYLVNLAITIIFDDYFAAHGQVVTDTTRNLFFAMNLSICSVVVFVFASYFVAEAISEREKANRLLLNVLPKQIAAILKDNDQTIADHFDAASVLFADIAGSTPLFAGLEPTEVVDWLNEIFQMFDNLVEKYGLEKIRTNGDNYMVASGVPTPRPDHAQAMTLLALDMVKGLEHIPARNGKRIAFRVGINSGPLVAGIIGKAKFHYDIWGDTVNVASRMESHGEVSRVHVSATTYDLIKNDFECVSRGTISIKGKGDMQTWFVVGRKST